MSWLVLPWILQGLLILFDEFVLHRRRGLPAWERVGHPLDTLSVLACFAVMIWREPGTEPLRLYAALALFSCAFVTKDEFVHANRCSPLEHWVHAMLFVLHPICLGSAGWAWWHGELGLFLRVEAVLICVFLGYQLLYPFLYRASDRLQAPKPMSGQIVT